jgi:thiol:disulfide interchange protein DsbD
VKHSLVALFLICLALAVAAWPAAAQVPTGKEVVAPTTYVSFDPVAHGTAFQVAVVMKIRPGFHVNAREVTQDYLIRTDLRAEVPVGFKVGDVIYPKGKLQTFSFSKDKPLNVYTDSITILLPVTALRDAPAGPQHLPLKLRYQACSDEICLPPVTLDLDVPLNVAATPGAAHPAHPEVFSPRK